jgi:hypothetical protein
MSEHVEIHGHREPRFSRPRRLLAAVSDALGHGSR